MSEPCQVGYVDRLGGVLRAEFDPMYGPAVRRKRVARSGGCGLASMYPAFGWSACSRPSWISAHQRPPKTSLLQGGPHAIRGPIGPSGKCDAIMLQCPPHRRTIQHAVLMRCTVLELFRPEAR